MNTYSYLQINPNKTKIVDFLCNLANSTFSEIYDTYAWNTLSKIAGLQKEDFYNDRDELIRKYGESSIDVYGLYNWKFKEEN